MKLVPAVVLLMAFGLMGLTVQSTASESGDAPSISRKDLKSAMADGKVTLIDCTGTQTYSERHIPGAIDMEANAERLAELLPADKKALIVSYCSNEDCPRYKDGVKAAARLGYKKIKHYAPGIRGWTNAGETVATSR